MIFKLFKKKPVLPPVDISVLQTDLHSHLIPGIDDGAQTLDDAVELVRLMKDLGYRKLIVTPHIQADFYKNTPEIILKGLDNLKAAVKNAGIDILIEAAAEYLIDDGFEEKMNKGELMCFGPDKYLLVELSYYNMNSRFFEYVFDLNVAGYKIILAHPERYAYFHDNFKIYEDLKVRSIELQINIISLSGYYSEQVKKIAEKLIDLDFVDYAASDMHNFNYYENFVKSLSSPYMHKLIEKGHLKNPIL